MDIKSLNDWVHKITGKASNSKASECYPAVFEYLDRDYLSGVEEYRKDHPEAELSEKDSSDCRNEYVKKWLKTTGLNLDANDRNLDDDQIAAVASIGSDVLVTARAGSGKTRTLVTRALFLINRCKVSPSKLLLVVFNNKARHEIINRLVKANGLDSLPHVMTFHSLAYAIAQPSRESLLAEEGDKDKRKEFIKGVIQRRLAGDETLREIWNFLLEEHFSKSFDEENDEQFKKKDQFGSPAERFIDAIATYIGLSRKSSKMPNELVPFGDATTSTVKELKFFELAKVIYESYLQDLKNFQRDDFDGLISSAIVALNGKRCGFKYSIFDENDSKKRIKSNIMLDPSDLKFVMIDEYQDFSKLFYDLILALRRLNPSFEVFCVGDDWQAINGFAGSELDYFLSHQIYFTKSPRRLSIGTNYRSGAAIVEYGNAIMKGKGLEARASNSTFQGRAQVINLDDYRPLSLFEKHEYGMDKSLPVVIRISKKLLCQVSNRPVNDQGIVFLSRLNHHLQFKPWFLNRLKRHLGEETVKKVIDQQNVHQYKGKQKETVIILDAFNNKYPHRHPDWIFTKHFGNSLEKIKEEERRLFYVAATRAIEKLYVITARNRTDFLSPHKLETFNWDVYPYTPTDEKETLLVIGNQSGTGSGATSRIKDYLGKAGFKYHGKHDDPRLRYKWAKLYIADNFDLKETLKREYWARLGTMDGIDITVFDHQGNIVTNWI